MTRVAITGALVAVLALTSGPAVADQTGSADEVADTSAQTVDEPAVGLDESTDESTGGTEVEEGTEDAVTERRRRVRSMSVRVATINVLGSSHTDGPRSRYASGVKRVDGLVRILKEGRLTIAGLQEFQPDQRVAFARKRPGYGMYPGGTKWDVGTTSIVWDVSRFSKVRHRLTEMPFYGRKTRMVPSVLLRDNRTGMRIWVTTVHNPRDGGRYRSQARQRSVATQRQIGLVKTLAAQRIPHVFTGDMNERGSFYCRFTGPGATNMTTPAGGSNTGGRCRPPARSALDWIFGSGRVAWSDFVVDRSPLVQRTTDHAVRHAVVTVNSRDFPRSYSRR